MTPQNATAQMNGIYTASQGGASISYLDNPPVMGPKRWSINGTVTLDGNAQRYLSFPKVQKKCRVMGFRAVAQEAPSSTCVVILLNGTTNQIASVSLTGDSAGDVNKALTVSPTYSTLNPGDTPVVFVANGGETTMPLSCQIDIVPVNYV